MLQPRTVFTDLETVQHDEDFQPRPCAEATAARPGSAEKIEVLRQRVANGEDLWHPWDSTVLPDPTTWPRNVVGGIRELSPGVLE